MKSCPQCHKDLPETALHCVHCGARQETAPKPARTVFGYDGADIKHGYSPARPQQPYGEPVARAPSYGVPAPQQPYGAPTQPSPPRGVAAHAPPRYPVPTASPAAPTRAMSPLVEPAPSYGPPAAQLPAMVPVNPQAGLGATVAPFGPPQPAHPYGAMANIPGRRYSAANPAYGEVPFEPWAGSLRIWMMVLGVLLVGCVVAPWSVAPGEVLFSWTRIGDARVPLYVRLTPVLIGGTGLVAVLFGALPVPVVFRAVVAMLLGLGPLAYFELHGGVAPAAPEGFARLDWRLAAGLAAATALVAALLVRSRYHDSLIARVLVTLGAGGILALGLVPDAGLNVVDGLRTIDWANVDPTLLVRPLHVVVAALALLAWLPTARCGALVWIWLTLPLPLVGSLLSLVEAPDPGARLAGTLASLVYLPFALCAWMTFASYGLASLIGKRLERG